MPVSLFISVEMWKTGTNFIVKREILWYLIFYLNANFKLEYTLNSLAAGLASLLFYLKGVNCKFLANLQSFNPLQNVQLCLLEHWGAFVFYFIWKILFWLFLTNWNITFYGADCYFANKSRKRWIFILQLRFSLCFSLATNLGVPPPPPSTQLMPQFELLHNIWTDSILLRFKHNYSDFEM